MLPHAPWSDRRGDRGGDRRDDRRDDRGGDRRDDRRGDRGGDRRGDRGGGRPPLVVDYASFAALPEEDEPPPGGFDAAYAELAARLAVAKSALDGLAGWDDLAESLNYYRGAQQALRRAFPWARITNAGLKMYEMATRLELAGFAASLGRPLRAFCNAELPGSFVSALLAYAARNGFELDWRASSYWVDEPGTSILGDKFGLYRDNPGRWLMGEGAALPRLGLESGLRPDSSPSPGPVAASRLGLSSSSRIGGGKARISIFDELDKLGGAPAVLPASPDEGGGATPGEGDGSGRRPEPSPSREGAALTGDMTDPAEVERVAAAARAAWGAGADLYTSDAGIFTDDHEPETRDQAGEFDQEADTAILNLGQILAGLLALAPGGRLVTKTYTLFRPESRALVGWLAGLFDEFRVDKPATSKPLNSEVYLVGVGYRPERFDGAAALAAMRAWRRGERPPAGPGPAEPAGLLAAERALASRQADHLAEARRLADAGARGDPETARRRSARWLSLNFA